MPELFFVSFVIDFFSFFCLLGILKVSSFAITYLVRFIPRTLPSPAERHTVPHPDTPPDIPPAESSSAGNMEKYIRRIFPSFLSRVCVFIGWRKVSQPKRRSAWPVSSNAGPLSAGAG